jgi:glutamate racemase
MKKVPRSQTIVHGNGASHGCTHFALLSRRLESSDSGFTLFGVHSSIKKALGCTDYSLFADLIHILVSLTIDLSSRLTRVSII